MKTKILILCLLILTFFFNFIANANTLNTIPPNNKTYQEGIYRLDKSDSKTYSLKFEFLNNSPTSAIIILDENNRIVYENSNCEDRCSAGKITNKNAIIVLGEGGTLLFFN